MLSSSSVGCALRRPRRVPFGDAATRLTHDQLVAVCFDTDGRALLRPLLQNYLDPRVGREQRLSGWPSQRDGAQCRRTRPWPGSRHDLRRGRRRPPHLFRRWSRQPPPRRRAQPARRLHSQGSAASGSRFGAYSPSDPLPAANEAMNMLAPVPIGQAPHDTVVSADRLAVDASPDMPRRAGGAVDAAVGLRMSTPIESRSDRLQSLPISIGVGKTGLRRLSTHSNLVPQYGGRRSELAA